jgi:chitin synthase
LAEFDSEKKRVLKVAVDLLALLVQVSGFVVWPLVESGREASLWFIPLALFLTSFGWWENFVSTTKATSNCDSQAEKGKKSKKLSLGMHIFGVHKKYQALPSKLSGCMLSFLAGIKKRAKKRRYYTYMFISVWKIIIIFATMLIVWHVNGELVDSLFNNFNPAFSPRKIPIQEASFKRYYIRV